MECGCDNVGCVSGADRDEDGGDDSCRCLAAANNVDGEAELLVRDVVLVRDVDAGGDVDVVGRGVSVRGPERSSVDGYITGLCTCNMIA